MPEILTLAKFKQFKSSAIVIKDYPKSVGYKERDISVKNGAEGALLMRNDYIVENIKFKEIEAQFKINEKDLLLVCFANSYKEAESACLAVSENLKPQLAKLFRKLY